MKYLIGLVLLMNFNVVFSQNDICTNAINLDIEVFCEVLTNGSFNGTGIESIAPNCGLNSSQDVWFKFTAFTSLITVAIFGENNLDIGFEILEGSCQGNSVLCYNQAPSGGSETTNFDTAIPGQTYYLRMFNAGAISNVSFQFCVFNFGQLNTKTVNIENKLSIYPNPVQDKLFIDSSENFKEIAVFDIYGKKVLNVDFQTKSLDVSGLSKGIYILKFLAESDEVFMRKFVKE